MTVLRMLILAIAVALGTVLLAWWVVPLLGAGYGLLSRGTRAPGLAAAAGSAIGWGGYLSIVSLGGAPVGQFGNDLAQAMQLPSWAPFVATLAFPALLAGPAAYVTARIGSRSDTKRR